MARRFVPTVVALCAASAVLAACGGTSGEERSPDGLTPLTLTFSTKETSFDFGLLGAVAKGAGFFEEEGLDVTLETVAGGSASVQTLVAGQSDVATTVPADIMTAAQKGADVKCFQAIITGFNIFPAAPQESGIRTYGDLAGKRVGVASLASSTPPLIKAMVAREGADPAAVEFVPITPGAPAIHAVQTGEVDALGYWDTQYAIMANLGLDLRPIEAKQGVTGPTFAHCYAATSNWLQENHDVAAAFGRAAARGYVFIRTNPEAAARITLETYPQLRSSTGDLEKDVQAGVRQIVGRLPYMEPVDGRIGYVAREQVQDSIELQIESGLVTGGLTPDDIWTDELVDEINQIDLGEVEKRAKEHRTG
jgi:NitT/TauT family transport system substrate-binding protein